MADVVVVGGGLAGARMCTLLRSAGFPGTVTLLGAEADPPYDRPPLTKDPEAEVDLRTAMGIDVWAHADEVRLGVAAHDLRPAPAGGDGEPWVVACADASTVRARVVVLATGAEPVLPAGWSRPGVHVLHTRSQAREVWSAVQPGVTVLIVGGGWIGCEAAATAAARGAQVRLVEAGPDVLAGQVPAQVSARVRTWLTEAGVAVRVGSRVTSLDDGAEGIGFSGGPPDLVLVALGVRPGTAWLADSGLRRAGDGAVLTDEFGRTSQAGVFAVGDSAARWSPRRSAYLPGGHWTEALSAPERVAPAVVRWLDSTQAPDVWSAADADAVEDPLPYVFSDIAGRTLLLLGDPVGDPAAESYVWRDTGDAWTCYTVDDQQRLAGLCTMGRPRDLVGARRAMLAHERGRPLVNPDALGDPDSGPAQAFVTESA